MNPFVLKTLELKNWAVVGASDKPGRASNDIVRLLKERGFSVFPINPRVAEIEGLTCYKGLSDLPVVPDVVDMVVNPERGLPVLQEATALGVKYAWLQPGATSLELHSFARENGMDAQDGCVLVALRSLYPDFRHD